MTLMQLICRSAAINSRSTRDLLNFLAATTEKKAGIRSLGDACADTLELIPGPTPSRRTNA